MYGITPPPLTQPASTGTVVPKTPAKPGFVKSRPAIWCNRCKLAWLSAPYNPVDDPLMHKLACLDGWTEECGTWTITYWEGLLEPEEEDVSVKS